MLLAAILWILMITGFCSSGDPQAQLSTRRVGLGFVHHQLGEDALQLLDRMNREAAAEDRLNRPRRAAFLRAVAGDLSQLKDIEQSMQTVNRPQRGRRRNAAVHEEENGLQEADFQDVLLTTQPNILVNGTLKHYQLDFLNWMSRLYNRGVSGILADEMGLGKTIQTVAMVGYLTEYLKCPGPHMIVVPKSTMSNWCREFRKWLPTIRIETVIGGKEERQEILRKLVPGTFDVILTSYEMLIIEKAFFNRFHWRFFVVDEAHRLKNEASRLSQVMRELRTNCRLLLTGTPLQNNLHELWALLNFLLPEEFSSSDAFESYLNVTAVNVSTIGDSQNDEYAQIIRRRLHGMLRPFMLRRLKTEVEKSVPDKTEINVYVGLTQKQRGLYANILRRDVDAISGGKGAPKQGLLNIIMQLRKACNHPYLFDGQEPGPPFEAGEHLIEASGKLKLLDRLLEKLQTQGSRVLIFSQMARMLDILEDYLNYRGYEYCRIDGKIAGELREEQIDAFMKPGSRKFVFLLSTRAGGLGLNLQQADQVVIYDSDWNPQADLQAMARAHRIGQTKNVTVYRLIQERTVEEKVVERAFQKLFLDAMVMRSGGGITATQKDKVSRNELLSMMQFGADQIMRMGAEASQNLDVNIDNLIAAGRNKTKQLTSSLEQVSKSAMSDFSFDGREITTDKFSQKLQEASANLSASVRDSTGQAGSSKSIPSPPPTPFFFDLGRRKRKPNKLVADVLQEMRDEAERKKKLKEDKKMKKPYQIPRMPKALAPCGFPDFQFFNNRQIDILRTKQRNWWQTYQKRVKAQWDRNLNVLSITNISQFRIRIGSAEIDRNQGLTDKEMKTMESLLSQGFSWSRRDYHNFRCACERRGRNDLEYIAAQVGKDIKEVRAYSETFWEKGPKRLSHWTAAKKTIERAEAQLRRRKKEWALVEQLLERYDRPLRELELEYFEKEKWPWSLDNDRFILVAGHQCYSDGVDCDMIWDIVQNMVSRVPKFKQDVWMRTQSPNTLQVRFFQLVRILQRAERTLQREQREGTGSTNLSRNVATKRSAALNVDEDGTEHDENDCGPASRADRNSAAWNTEPKRQKE